MRTQAIPEWVHYGIFQFFWKLLKEREGQVTRNAVQRKVLLLKLLN